jgi:hypothetical protein
MFPSSVNLADDAGHTVITSYALHRPDGNWAIMPVNRDPDNAHPVHIVFEDSNHHRQFFADPVMRVTFGSDQYVWHDEGENGHPDPDSPPVGSAQPGGQDATYILPKGSVTILRGLLRGDRKRQLRDY